MINFDKLIGTSESVDFTDLMAVFESLDRQTSHTELRPSQLDAINELSKYQNEEDIILKVSTGGGKTVIALLYLYSQMKSMNEPVVYLCPTTQLVDQVIEEAGKLGIKTTNYRRGEKSPGADFLHADSIIVCTYDKLFNGKSTFNRPDVMLRPCAIVLDDAHSGLEIIRRSFCLTLDGECHFHLILPTNSGIILPII
ncbi:MAG: DEAD/DEAH box helicase family protein [Candidatus Delongbacteria bacterium]|nr:DEAD/DEAH box helicase family protein [Candidatus Delongbacteria bacterium]